MHTRLTKDRRNYNASAARQGAWFALMLLVTAPGLAQPSGAVSPADDAALKSYSGRYQASPDTIVTVRQEGKGLAMEVNYGTPMELVPGPDGRFIHEKSGTRISFARDNEGKVTELILHRGSDHRAKRIGDAASSEQVRIVEAGGTKYQTLISGEGSTPVVLVSGIQNWAKVAAGLEREARVVRFKARAGGEPAVPGDIRTQARRLHELLNTLQIARPFILAGHSFDGALVRFYAGLHPRDVSALVLVDPLDEGFVDWLKEHQPANYELFEERARKQYVSDWADFLDRLRRTPLPKTTPVIILTAGERGAREKDGLEKQISPRDLKAASRALIQAHQARAASVPTGKQVVVQNAGHDIPREQPQSVIDAIKEMLRQIKDPGK